MDDCLSTRKTTYISKDIDFCQLGFYQITYISTHEMYVIPRRILQWITPSSNMVNTNLRVTPWPSPGRIAGIAQCDFHPFQLPGLFMLQSVRGTFRFAHCTKQQVFIKRLGIVMNTALNRRTFIAAAGAAGASIAAASVAIAEEPPAGEPPADAGQDGASAAVQWHPPRLSLGS